MHADVRGFTMIELLIVVSIVAILFGAALPHVDAMVARNRAAAAHNGLLATINYARSSALVANAAVVVCPSSDGITCRGDGVWEPGWISFVDRDGDHVHGPGDELLRRERDQAHGMLIRTGSARPRLRFLRNGMSAGTNMTVRMCAPDGLPLQGVVVSQTGRARRASADEVAAFEPCR